MKTFYLFFIDVTCMHNPLHEWRIEKKNLKNSVDNAIR